MSHKLNEKCVNCTYTCKQYDLGEIINCQKIKDANNDKKKKGITR